MSGSADRVNASLRGRSPRLEHGFKELAATMKLSFGRAVA